jgi:hypothetical protein
MSSRRCFLRWETGRQGRTRARKSRHRTRRNGVAAPSGSRENLSTKGCRVHDGRRVCYVRSVARLGLHQIAAGQSSLMSLLLSVVAAAKDLSMRIVDHGRQSLGPRDLLVPVEALLGVLIAGAYNRKTLLRIEYTRLATEIDEPGADHVWKPLEEIAYTPIV